MLVRMVAMEKGLLVVVLISPEAKISVVFAQRSQKTTKLDILELKTGLVEVIQNRAVS